MKKRFLLPMLISALALSGCAVKIGNFVLFGIVDNEFLLFATIEENKPQEEEQEPPYDVDEKVVGSHYDGYDLTKTGGRLLLELQRYCFDKHTQWVTYGQMNTYFSKTSTRNSAEAIADGSSTNQYFYTGKEASGTGTREHVWPCANSGSLWTHDNPGTGNFSAHYVDNSYYVGGGSDLYHVRTCNSKVNTARGNSKFVSFDDPEYAEKKSLTVTYGESGGKWEIRMLGASELSGGGYEYADRTEPDDHMKGDVARIVLYVYTHYMDRGITPEGGYKPINYSQTFMYSDMTGSLPLTQIMGYPTEERCLEVLKAWNKLDAPSTVEKLRNDTVQKIQGNRNPFVDYPNLVDQL